MIYTWWKNRELDKFIEADILKDSVLPYLKICDEYNKQRNVGHNYTNAVRLTAEATNASISTVKRAIALML